MYSENLYNSPKALSTHDYVCFMTPIKSINFSLPISIYEPHWLSAVSYCKNPSLTTFTHGERLLTDPIQPDQ